jgi:2-keto-4-pentenoate hydratase
MNGPETDLMTEDARQAAALLVEATLTGKRIAALNITPASVAQAHAIQDQVTATLNETIGGFKANAPPGQSPTRGVIYAARIFASPARINASMLPHKAVEGEIAFRFLRDLPARDTDYARAEVVEAVAALVAIEVLSGQFIDLGTSPPLQQLADRLANAALVIGPELTGWKSLDIARLKVTVWVNDEVVAHHVGSHPINDPLAVAVALVNMMRTTTGVKAGQIVTTGSCTGLRRLQTEDRFKVAFEGLGAAELTFAP